MSYTIQPIDKPKFSFPARNKTYSKVKMIPLIRTNLQYSEQGKKALRFNVIYSISVDFVKPNKPKETFISAQWTFLIVKEDEHDFDGKSEAAFKAVKMLETEFHHYMKTRTPPLELIGTLIKPVTFESWQRLAHNTNNNAPLN